jgi:hypothetical protein
MATNNFDKQTEEICALLRNGISAEEIANNLSAALQAAEKQLAEEIAAKKTEEDHYYEEKLKSELCNCLRNYVSATHSKAHKRFIELHGHDFTDDEIIELIDRTIKNTAVAIKLYDVFESYGNEATITQKLCDNKENANKTTATNWEKLFNDFFDKYNL